MPVAPLVEQHEAELTKFYVRPPMMAYNRPNASGQKTLCEEENKTEIHSYRELFFKDSKPYREIYVTADAGMGKTSFAKMLALTWCEAHDPQKQTTEDVELSTPHNRSPRRNDVVSFNSDDIDAMNKFEFLFLIQLREFKRNCSLDQMILQLLQSKLPNSKRYTTEFLDDILCNKQCLVVVDGLDEWIHPESCDRGEVIPHKKLWPECTVLTTTRPWKLSTALLLKSDRHLELSELDETTARKLESDAIDLLNNMRPNSNTKTVTDFRNTEAVKLLPEVCYIPFVLLQMICLWFDNCFIGSSLCEIYSNIIELTLTRWLVKTDNRHETCKCKPSEEHKNIEIKCMRNNTHCRCNISLLTKIGELAFSTLFSVIQENSLLFDEKQVLNCLDSKKELSQCLNMGLISQVKGLTSCSKVSKQYYFSHKTFHEFFCALFIATNWNDMKTKKAIKEKLSDKCKSISHILEMYKMFVFVCGLNPEVYSDICRHLATILDKDITVIDHRKSPELCHQSLADYQKMQISCFLESTRNQTECKLVLEDVMLDQRVQGGELEALVKILSNNTSNIKSLLLSYPFALSKASIYEILKQSNNSCLETLRIESVITSLVVPFLPDVLTAAANTLEHLYLYEVSVTAKTADAISTLKNLRDLRLSDIDVSADTLNGIGECIGKCISLRRLYLTNVKYLITHKRRARIFEFDRNSYISESEQDNVSDRNSYVLNLNQHSNLQELELEFPLAELHINTKNLMTCEIRNMVKFSAHAVSTLLTAMNGAPVLETFKLINIKNQPPTLCITDQRVTQKAKYALEHCDIRDSTFTITLPRVTQFTLEYCDRRESTVPLTLPQVKKFTLKQCNLRDTLTLPQVMEFTLVHCDLRDSTLTLTLPQVEKFTLEHSNLINSTPTLKLPKVKEFTLKHCNLRDSIVALTLTQVTNFTLEHCDLFDSILIVTLPLVTKFALEHSDLKNSNLILRLPRVTNFILEHCDLRDSTVTLTLPKVMESILEHCAVRVNTLSLTLPQVEKFTLEHCDLRDSTVILTLPKVTKFALEHSDLKNSNLILRLPRVTNFILEHCDLRDSTVTLTLPQVTEFTLKSSDLRVSTLTLTLPQVTKFALEHSDLKNSNISLTLPKVTNYTLKHCDLSKSTVTLTLPHVTEFSLEHSDLKKSTLILTLPQVTKSVLEHCSVKDNTLNLTLTQVTKFTLEHYNLIDRILTLTLPQVTQFALEHSYLKNSTLSLTLPKVANFTLKHCDFSNSTVTLTLPYVSEFTLEHSDLKKCTLILTLPQLTKSILDHCSVKDNAVVLTLTQGTMFALEHYDLIDRTLTLTLLQVTQFALEHSDLKNSNLILTLPNVKEFTLKHCDLSNSTVTLTLPLLRKLILTSCHLEDSTVTLSRDTAKLETISFLHTRLNITCCRKLFLNMIKRPQPITSEVLFLSMTVGEWRELLFDILGKSLKSIQLKMFRCMGQSVKEWRDIHYDMKASQAFRILSFYLDVGKPVAASFICDIAVV